MLCKLHGHDADQPCRRHAADSWHPGLGLREVGCPKPERSAKASIAVSVHSTFDTPYVC